MQFGHLLVVGAGGFLGTVGRFVATAAVNALLDKAWSPYGTATVNIVGCLCIGLLSGLGEARDFFSVEQRLFLLAGLLGGFTTFSTFEYETMVLVRDGHLARALANVLLQVSLGFLCVWVGYHLMRPGAGHAPH